MKTLRECIADAEQEKFAVGHFNISNLETLWGIFRGAKKFGAPVIIGVSEGERSFIGARQAAVLVKSVREEFDYPIFINADHSYSFDKVKEAVDAGYDAVIFDGARLPFEENAAISKKCVDYARSVNPEIIIEGELGYIGSSSKLLESIPEKADVSRDELTKPEDLSRFVKETGIDLAAPAIGNLHGMLKRGGNPGLDIGLLRELRKNAGVPLVLHGGSGISDEDIRSAVANGISVVHVNTELRTAYRKALVLSLQENPEEIAPYKFVRQSVQAVENTVEKKLRLFGFPR